MKPKFKVGDKVKVQGYVGQFTIVSIVDDEISRKHSLHAYYVSNGFETIRANEAEINYVGINEHSIN